MPKVLLKEQEKLLLLIRQFNQDFGLVGGTAIALQLKHRRSVDFDLFSNSVLKIDDIKRKIRAKNKIERVLVESKDELTLIVDGVKLTFYYYPFALIFSVKYKEVIKMPSLIILAAMKVYALGRRAKWKDYVDLYFIFKKYSFSRVVSKAKQMFGGEFSEKLLREQLCFYRDIDKSEQLRYLPGYKISDQMIEDRLKEISLS
jgi:hypothetical protein